MPSRSDALDSPALRGAKQYATSATRATGLRTRISSRILKPVGLEPVEVYGRRCGMRTARSAGRSPWRAGAGTCS